jgi:hypothetical protein
MRTHLRFSAFAAAVALLGACATGPDIRSMSDRSVDFRAYETYDFIAEPATDQSERYGSLLTKYLKEAVSKEMEARGYTRADQDPDLLINFKVRTEERTQVRETPTMTMSAYYGYRSPYYGVWGAYPYATETTVTSYPVGTLNIDIVDAGQKQLVWEGVAEGRITSKALENPEAAIGRVVPQIFERYPVPATPAP